MLCWRTCALHRRPQYLLITEYLAAVDCGLLAWLPQSSFRSEFSVSHAGTTAYGPSLTELGPEADLFHPLQEFLALLKLKPNEKVLDVGCGIGGGDFLMAENYSVFVHGIDLSVNMVLLALERASNAKGTKVRSFQPDASSFSAYLSHQRTLVCSAFLFWFWSSYRLVGLYRFALCSTKLQVFRRTGLHSKVSSIQGFSVTSRT